MRLYIYIFLMSLPWFITACSNESSFNTSPKKAGSEKSQDDDASAKKNKEDNVLEDKEVKNNKEKESPEGENPTLPNNIENTPINTVPVPGPITVPSPTPAPPTPSPTPKVQQCSSTYTVPASANPYLAGTPNLTRIDYPQRASGSYDIAPQQSPIRVQMNSLDCLKGGTNIFLSVSGTISHGSNTAPSNADGSTSEAIQEHVYGGYLGKSNIYAPFNSLVGVFLGDGDIASMSTPAALSFATTELRNYSTISPVLGQIFFIGNGIKDDGSRQKIVVPYGSKNFFLGIMDSFEWNNNSGSLSGTVFYETMN